MLLSCCPSCPSQGTGHPALPAGLHGVSSTCRKCQRSPCLFPFSKVLPKHSAQISSKSPQDVLSREDGLHGWKATKLMEPEFPFLSSFTLKWDVWWVGPGCSSGGRCSVLTLQPLSLQTLLGARGLRSQIPVWIPAQVQGVSVLN